MLYIIVTKTISKTKKSSKSTIIKTKTKTRLHFLLKLIISILKLFSLPKQYCHTASNDCVISTCLYISK